MDHGQPVQNQKIFAVGDIHGCMQKLTALMERLPVKPEEDFLIFLGDYINRGPDSCKVIQFLITLQQRFRHIVFLMGNHEYELLEYARSGDPERLQTMRPLGVEATLKSYGDAPMRSLLDLSFLPEDHREFFLNLRPYLRLGNYLFTHAGVVPGVAVQVCPLDQLLTVRHLFLNYEGPLEHTVVFGHTPFLTPFLTANKIGIDTGAANGNMLTAVELPRLIFYHA